MENTQLTTVTVIYFEDNSLELYHEARDFPYNENGRVIIPESFKEGKSIIAVCHGEVVILNKLGDRIVTLEQAS